MFNPINIDFIDKISNFLTIFSLINFKHDELKVIIATYTKFIKEYEKRASNIDHNNLPEQYTFEKIKNEIFPKFNQNEVEKYFIKDDNIINMEKKMSDETYKQPKTRNRGIKLPKEEKKKSGRKRKEDTSDSYHNKYSPDNIIKKIKTKILDCLLNFINKLL